LKVENMNITPERVRKTSEVGAREAVSAIFPDCAKNKIDTYPNSKFGKVAIHQEPIENNIKNSFADYRNKLNNPDADPTKIPLEIGNLLAELRKAKANEVL
jgi:hypothetical protein